MKTMCPQSIKFQKLKRRLRLSQWQTIGILEAVWLFAQVNAQDGAIGRHSNEDICASIEWAGDPDELINELVECGWLDRSPRHRLLVHDWADHLPTYLLGAMARHKIPLASDDEQPANDFGQAAGEASSLVDGSGQPAKQGARQSAELDAECVQQSARQPAECVQQPAPRVGLGRVGLANHTTPNAADAAECASDLKRKAKKPKPDEHPLFEKFWTAYPRHENRQAAAKAFGSLDPSESLLGIILGAISWQKNFGCLIPNQTREGRSTIPHASSWLNGKRWTDEPPPTTATASSNAAKQAPELTDAERLDVGDEISDRLMAKVGAA